MRGKSGHLSVSRRAASGLVMAVAGAVAGLLLAGCGGGGSATSVGPSGESASASGSPTGTATGAPDPSPSPTPPAEPRAAVEQAVRDYLDAANVAMATGDTTRLRALSTPECTCLRLAESIESLYASGGRAEGARWDLEDLTVVDVTGASGSVRIVFVAPAYQEIRAVAKEIPAQRFTSLVTLSSGGGWLISDWDKLSEAPA